MPTDPSLPRHYSGHSVEPSLRDLAGGIISSIVDGIRQNVFASLLALVGLVVFIPLTLGTRYDERPRYRQVVLPEIQRLENLFEGALERAVDAPTPSWRLYHFIDAHRRAKDVLEGLRLRRPVTPEGIRAHDDLILYYELVNEHMAIIRTEMSLHLDLDFLSRWREARKEIAPLRERWVHWVEG